MEDLLKAIEKANFNFRYFGQFYAFASAKAGQYEFRAVKKFDGSVDFLILSENNRVEVTLPYWDKELLIKKLREVEK